MSKKLLFIYNAKSGKAKVSGKLSEIIDVFIKADYRVEIYQTQAPQDAIEQVKKVGEEFDLVVCSGGDGTLNEVVSGVMALENKPVIGYIPSGSTNDFGKSVGLDSDMVKSADIAVNGSIMTLDVGEFNENRNFIYIAAFGIFTEVSYLTSQKVKNILGHQAYIIEAIKSLVGVRTYEIKIEYEDTVIEDEFIYGMVTNSKSVGGFKGITGKDVMMDDGLYECTFVKLLRTPIEFTSAINALLLGTKSERVCTFKTSNLKVTCEDLIPWVLDGEYGGGHRKVSIRNQMNAIQVMTEQPEQPVEKVEERIETE
jgi:YegS/Rv2252/BmrU family lipid kinase